MPVDELRFPKGVADALGFAVLKRPVFVSVDEPVGLAPNTLLAPEAVVLPNRPPMGAELVGVPVDCEPPGFMALPPNMLKGCCGLLVPNNVDVELPVLLAGGGPAGVVEGLLPIEKSPVLFEAGVVVSAPDVPAVPVDPRLLKTPPDELPPKLLIVLLAAPPKSP